tara:strand:+ start:3678 stop:4220 length:543 start_codon:yes stop_codon:yes gene_type:complete
MGFLFLFVLILVGAASGIIFLNKGEVASEVKNLLSQIFEDIKKLFESLKNLFTYLYGLLNENETELSQENKINQVNSDEKTLDEKNNPNPSLKIVEEDDNSSLIQEEPSKTDEFNSQKESSIQEESSLKIESEKLGYDTNNSNECSSSEAERTSSKEDKKDLEMNEQDSTNINGEEKSTL